MEISAAKFSKANVYFCGGLLNTAAGLALGLVVNPSFGWLIPMAILLGVGTSTTIIQTYAIAAEVFGQDEQTSGFCFGIMGIFEKAVNGGVIIGIQERVPTGSMALPKDFFYRTPIGFVTTPYRPDIDGRSLLPASVSNRGRWIRSTLPSWCHIIQGCRSLSPNRSR